MKFTELNYGVENTILLNDHFVAIKVHVDNTYALASDGVIKAGTAYPSNDANAIGIFLHDTDVSQGACTAAVVVHGFINKDQITMPATTAVNAMKQIYFGTK